MEFEINKTLASLRAQGIEVGTAGITTRGEMVRRVMGFMLTSKQILSLYRNGNLNREGISEYARREGERQQNL